MNLQERKPYEPNNPRPKEGPLQPLRERKERSYPALDPPQAWPQPGKPIKKEG